VKVIQRTHDVKSFRLERPSGFSYKAGQFLFITIEIDGEEKRKHFSFSSSPTENGYVEFTKKLTGHEFSNALDELREGDLAGIVGPFGNFTFEGDYERIGMLTGGIGITALRSICKFCTDNLMSTDIILLYGNRTENDIVFRDELDGMQKENRNLKIIHTLSQPNEEWPGHVGRIDKVFVVKEIPDYQDRVFYCCGPPGLVESIKQMLTELGVSKKKLIVEQFPGYG